MTMNPSERLDKVLEDSGLCGAMMFVWDAPVDDGEINYAFSHSPDAKPMPSLIAIFKASTYLLEGAHCTCGAHFGENRLGRQ